MGEPINQAQSAKITSGNFYTPENSAFYSKFHYSDLDPKTDNIRLLRIKRPDPANPQQATIDCDLIDSVSLASYKDKYTTISYCAGSPKNIEPIIVNGCSFNAFANLGHALRQARYFWRDKFDEQELLLWADQVCINQSSHLERSHQVRLMGEIYAASARVLVSLSTENDIGGSIEWLETVLPDLRKAVQHQDYFSDPGRLAVEFFSNNLADEYFHLGWNAFICTFLKSSWWSRAWIRQEFIRSPDAYLMAKFHWINWKGAAEFIGIYDSIELEKPIVIYEPNQWAGHPPSCQACSFCGDSYLFMPVLDAQPASTLLTAKTRAESQPGRFGDLLDHISDVDICVSSDSRDLVYALLGISNHDYGLYPDYSPGVTLEDIVCQLARNVISHNKSLDVLTMAYWNSSTASVPSWVPDLRSYSLFRSGRPIEQNTQFNAAVFSPSFHSDGKGRKDRVLRVQGVRHEVLRRKIKSKWTRKFLSTTGEGLRIMGLAQEGDEIWMLHGSSTVFILREKDKQHYEIVGAVPYPDEILDAAPLRLHRLRQDINRLVESNDPKVEFINLC
ncbi:heterokaryon incompatibility protein-domain-containing protein [Echria macrotheca]|uniref:Heterokaryon incompatibility protein-domain-containing protein n=1 Tax=Echria macrotheca TaxID=438768 RepID=A0AAJ0FE20_9PEZI|nr:heterokaryon incompatibility protein-domain-containing protein [Echria macrotheca]